MKTRLCSLLVLALGFSAARIAHAQGTAFTYQGRLDDGGNAYTGSAEFQATLWDAVSGGSQIAANAPAQVVVGVTNGLFVLPLNFGANFPGANRWLQLEVRTAFGSFTTLTPRQPLTPAPYAITAGNLTGTLPVAQLSGTVADAQLSPNVSLLGASIESAEIANGTIVAADVNAASFNNTFWLLGGNAGANPTNGAFLGTRDEQPLEFKVNNERVLRLEFNTNLNVFGSPSPNLISGHASNQVASGVSGATIAGGGGTNWYGPTSPQRVSGEFSTIGGGVGNVVHAPVAVIAGGERGFIGTNAYNSFMGAGAWNSIEGADATLSGGRNNTNQGYAGSISGGVQNNVSGNYAAIGGGSGNQANGYAAMVPGGAGNVAAGSHSFAAGASARANHTGTFVWADASGGAVNSTGNNQFLIRAAGGVGIGTTTPGATLDVRTTSGTGNAIRFGYYTGGEGNLIAGPSRVGIATGDMVERISIPQGTGNIGIGTITPSQKLHVIGNILASGTITPNSDVNAKTNFAPVNVAEILERVAMLPIQQWRFRAEAENVKHVGPMAQDFRAAFGLGEIPTAIATVDADGVTLAAIQGLNQKLEATEKRVKEKEDKISALEARLHELEKLVFNRMNQK